MTSYEIRVEPREGYLFVSAAGPYTGLAGGVQLFSKMLALCREHGYDQLLFVREGRFDPTPVDAHMLARVLAEMGFDRIRLAFVAPMCDTSLLSFVEMVAVQTGITGRTFDDVTQAERWIGGYGGEAKVA